jgi:hypothetical protein
METELLTLRQAARRTGVTQTWLRREAESGRVPCLQADKRLLFDAAALERALGERASKSERGPAS